MEKQRMIEKYLIEGIKSAFKGNLEESYNSLSEDPKLRGGRN